ncbi:PREDICTED: gastrula zinc finger protein XlCGF8.2DB-like [Ceratosolen solmsi marchali]|uniref:Gastrula zinc finger protein XlCGF8.2DB-like n=1 Tax=Ceratosolen solmsi marchali TaxID=326594 RepID=A0AAJ6YWQ9_9HYME|nr:PREDICTED: gastrula zinc finger protein XlCGF8.2DB-like [Ceratosolen solmsi marchali]
MAPSVLSSDGPPYGCQRCGRHYSHKCNLLRHLRLECGVGPRFRCSNCEKRFKHRHHLRDHEKTHLHGPSTALILDFDPLN